MTLLARLLGTVAIVVHLALGLFMLGLGVVGWDAGSAMRIDLIPVEPESMATTLMLSGLVAVAAATLALRRGKGARALLVVWSVCVCGVLAAAFFRSSYRFEGEEHFYAALEVLAGSLVVLFGSILHWRRGGASGPSGPS